MRDMALLGASLALLCGSEVFTLALLAVGMMVLLYKVFEAGANGRAE